MHKLSNDLCVKQAIGGAMVYSPADTDEPTQRAPGTSYLVLSDDEICRLVAWWVCRNGHAPGDDLVGFVVGMACDGMISQETATVLLRALMARNASEAADRMLAGWVMEGEL